MTEVKAKFFRTTVTVSEGDRALVLKNGKFDTILRPGRYVISNFRTKIEVELHSLNTPEFKSGFAKALLAEQLELADAHFTQVKAAPQEVAVVVRDGKLFGVLKPDALSVFWTDAGPWKVEKIDVSDTLALDEKLSRRIASLGLLDQIGRAHV